MLNTKVILSLFVTRIRIVGNVDTGVLDNFVLLYLLTECLKMYYFQCNNELFLQNDGCAMGSPVSVTVADIFLQKIEKHVTYEPRNPKKKSGNVTWVLLQ